MRSPIACRPRRLTKVVESVCTRLHRRYGKPRLDNPQEPLDDLIFIVLSNKTTPGTAGRVYGKLKQRFATWNHLLLAPARTTKRILRPAGLSGIKTAYIRAALRKIRRDFGTCDLSARRRRSPQEAEHYLGTLPCVSLKVAKCVGMYTLGGEVLPVDSHVHRVTVRLGWTNRRRADQCHEELESLIPGPFRFALHVDLIVHGRLVCRPKAPLCGDCCIRNFCKFDRKTGDDGQGAIADRH